ncbi:Oidioi.mRNA.OKI2018_I69.PAR.g12946.t1.cds [Oikopleura dioica]|uniref:Oidioi.mRNA.OKI2018_I69.PAR.g12946.t1.cds n=1 Tax=Oikopleura dioica TaxID=34765 RepID=A0ABN7S2F7_OIKDI|nr:Oidioi.mRNA.OKI2018_I69.PAR.g12946.t1.cds [Oikopleura dioica]
MVAFHKGIDVRKEQSYWNNPDFKRTSHVFCDKDDEQGSRIIDIIKKRREGLREIMIDATAAFKEKVLSRQHDILLQVRWLKLLTREEEEEEDF